MLKGDSASLCMSRFLIKNLTFSSTFSVAKNVCALLLIQCSLAVAQDYERIAPKPAPQVEPDEEQSDGGSDFEVKQEGGGQVSGEAGDDFWEEGIEEAEEPVLAEKVVGIRFVQKSEEIIPEGVDVVGLEIPSGHKILDTDDFRNEMDYFLGKPLTLTLTNDLRRAVVAYYKKKDRPVVRVVVPEQDVTEGKIQVLVLVGTLGKITVEGNKYFGRDNFTREIRLRDGEEIRGDKLLADLKWLNKNPFRNLNMVYAPGEGESETDIHLKVKDRFPVRFYAGFEDSGNDVTQDERWLTGMNWGNAFGLDHQLNYQFTMSSDVSSFNSHSANYLIPLPWRHELNLFGSFTQTHANLAAPQDLTGKSWQTSAHYNIPLPEIPGWEGFSHNGTLGMDFKQSNSNLDTGGVQVFDTTTDVFQFVFGYDFAVKDFLGRTTLDFNYYYSPGDWTDGSKDTQYQLSRARADANYSYMNVRISRFTKLPWDFAWIMNAKAQIASENLLGSEQMGLGGYSSVRGYEEREANGDEGFFWSHELRTPPMPIGKWLGQPKWKDSLQVLGFWDYGQVEQRYLLAGQDEHIILSSAGVGCRYNFNQYLSFRFDFGWQLTDSGAAGNNRRSERAHMGLTLSY